jgi:H+/Cl- antiporter ClcA
MKTPFNKYLYFGFILLGSYQALFNKDYMQAVASFGIGLAFDPFDQTQKWKERPTWQKALLYLHLAVVAGLFGLAVGLNDR